MDWLRRYQAVIICDEKLVQVPYGNETLTFCGNESSNGRESRLAVISYSKAQEYMAKGCQVFLAQISAKKKEDKSERKQIEDVPIVRDFPEVFPEDLPGLPPPTPSAPTGGISNRRRRGSIEEHLKANLELLKKEKLYAKVFKIVNFVIPKCPNSGIIPELSVRKPFVVYCDASHKGLGAVLMQREKGKANIVADRAEAVKNGLSQMLVSISLFNDNWFRSSQKLDMRSSDRNPETKNIVNEDEFGYTLAMDDIKILDYALIPTRSDKELRRSGSESRWSSKLETEFILKDSPCGKEIVRTVRKQTP
ncbi:reverse transcriptase domain-containing protein [Tanacetum coccineum]